MTFEFATAGRIVFGNGSLKKVGEIASGFGGKALVVTGSGSVQVAPLLALLEGVGVEAEIFRVGHEPDISTIDSGLALAKEKGCTFVIGFGGGSSLDSAKAISALLTNQGELMDYLEVVGKGQKIANRAAPMIALPTTAGTGTEVTRNAVISSPEHNVKVSMRSPLMIPSVAVVDPELTLSMPPSVTASTGMDALTQVIEAYVSSRANPMTDIISADGIQRGARSLLAAYKDGQNLAAREDMALTSLYGGLALANGGLGAVHGFAGLIGGMFQAAHGAICASLLPYVMKYNAQVLQSLPGKDEMLRRFQQVAAWLTGDSKATIDEGVSWLAELAKALQIPGLHDMGITKADFPRIIEKSKVSSSMQKNPVKLDERTLEAILSEAF
ncbi:iron-containing alcohol dehydrogenase [Chloroflexota bacterium]|nr:iron-containing alcohol dehydrogenase [Chloroflexota bacterium]